MRRKRSRNLSVAGGYLFLLLLVAFWEFSASNGGVAKGQLASPRQVLHAITTDFGWIVGEAWHSMRRTVLAFGLGGASGLCLGLCHGVFPLFRRTTGIVIEGLRPLPSVALIPLAMLAVGMGDGLNVCVAAFACAWPTFISAYDGVVGINPVLVDSALTIGIARQRLFRVVILPAALPVAVTGLRISLAIAFAVELSTEMIVPKHGIGALALVAAFSGDIPLVYAALTVAAILGFFLNRAFRGAEHYMLRHYGPPWCGVS